MYLSVGIYFMLAGYLLRTPKVKNRRLVPALGLAYGALTLPFFFFVLPWAKAAWMGTSKEAAPVGAILLTIAIPFVYHALILILPNKWSEPR